MPIPILCWVAHGTHVQRVSRFIAHRMHKHENFVRATVTQAMRVYRTYIQDIIMLRYAKHIHTLIYVKLRNICALFVSKPVGGGGGGGFIFSCLI